jgi:hypothetical protein
MNTYFFLRPRIWALTGLSLLTVAALAQPSGGGQGGPGGGERRHRQPSPQAIVACNGKASGAECSFAGRQGRQLHGTCFAPPAGAQAAPNSSGNQDGPPMVCRAHRGRPGGGQPPPR